MQVNGEEPTLLLEKAGAKERGKYEGDGVMQLFGGVFPGVCAAHQMGSQRMENKRSVKNTQDGALVHGQIHINCGTSRQPSIQIHSLHPPQQSWVHGG